MRLEVRGVSVRHRRRPAPAVVGADLSVEAGEIVGLVGESGSGKTSLVRAIAGVGPRSEGTVWVDGVDVTTMPLGRRGIQMVFQNPLDALDPLLTVGASIGEAVRAAMPHAAVAERVDELLALVRLDRSTAHRRPAALSGGQRQRASIARALATNPPVLLCDEITSALDLSVQAAIAHELARLAADLDLSIVFVSHDLPLVVGLCHRIVVMQRGEIADDFVTSELFSADRHACTNEMVSSATAIVGADRPDRP